MKFIIKCLPVFILGVILFVPSALADNTVKRIGGSTRYDTAVLAAKQSWGEAKTVIITGGTSYADAIAAAPLAYQKMRRCCLQIKISCLPAQKGIN